MSDSTCRYLAFISYSRSDNEHEGRHWADWIKETIEQFPVPLDYLGQESLACQHSMGAPREVFLDQSSMTAGGELRSKLNQWLDNSEFLVLLCSPRSAASEYVAFEIDHFKRSGKWDRIIPVVIDGEDSSPNSRACWIPGNLPDAIMDDPVDGSRAGRLEGSLVYADFRVKENRPDDSVLIEAGWTDPAFYERHLRHKKLLPEMKLNTLVSAYRESHKVAKCLMLGAIFGLTPQQVCAALQEQHEHQKLNSRGTKWRSFLNPALLKIASWCGKADSGMPPLHSGNEFLKPETMPALLPPCTASSISDSTNVSPKSDDSRYDVFISAKSQDYAHAREAAEFLRRAGLRVFFSEQELPEMGNSDYYEAIDNALEDCRHMLVVTSSRDHVESKWVKKEWKTYLNEQLNERKSGNLVTLLCGNIEINDLPLSLRQKEARRQNDLSSLLKYFKH